jgi:hypothetical protein
VFPILSADVEGAKGIVLGNRELSARDALHVAVMRREGISRVMSFDSGFDSLPGITRLGA